MIVDLVMWTKNGGKTLPKVMNQIKNVIPSECIHRKILVDDHSTDHTRQIAQDHNWKVCMNPSGGISSGANEALKYVDCDFFISIEQDLVLADDWWLKIPQHLTKPQVAIASGIRLTEKLEAFSKIEEFAYERYKKRRETGKFDFDKFLYGKTIDNTIYKTEAIRSMGGFPKLTVGAGVDNVLAYHTYLARYEWFVDHSVKSEHLRTNLKDELTHRYWYGTCFDGLSMALGESYPNFKRHILRLVFSPIRGLQIGISKRDLRILCIYPLIRFNVLRGIIDSRKKGKKK